MAYRRLPLLQVDVLSHQGIGLLARRGQSRLIGQLNIIGEVWTTAYMPQPILTPLHQEGPKLLLGLRDGSSCEGHPLESLASPFVLYGDTCDELSVAFPQPSN